jgi:hypothetical protein
MIASVPLKNCDLHVVVIAKMTKYQDVTLSARRIDYRSPWLFPRSSGINTKFILLCMKEGLAAEKY